MIRGAVFDVDGTLLDSMPIWLDAGARYLKSIMVQPEDDLGQILWDMSIPEGSAYLKNHYKLPYTEEEIQEGIIRRVRDFYYYEASLKPGVLEFLETFREKGIPMVIATSGDRSYLKAAFERTGLEPYFCKIFTCKEVGAGKTKPLIYQTAARYLNLDPQEVVVFEDVLHAVKTARDAHFQVVGIYDVASAGQEAFIKEESHVYLKDFTEVEKFWDYFSKE